MSALPMPTSSSPSESVSPPTSLQQQHCAERHRATSAKRDVEFSMMSMTQHREHQYTVVQQYCQHSGSYSCGSHSLMSDPCSSDSRRAGLMLPSAHCGCRLWASHRGRPVSLRCSPRGSFDSHYGAYISRGDKVPAGGRGGAGGGASSCNNARSQQRSSAVGQRACWRPPGR